MPKEYTFNSVGEIIDLWTNNTAFKKLVGPTHCHLKVWLYKQGYTTFIQDIMNKTRKLLHNHELLKPLTCNINNELEEFITIYQYSDEYITKYILPYIDYYYKSKGLTYLLKEFMTYNDPIVKPNHLVKYLIDNNINLNGCTASKNLVTGDIQNVFKLIELGLNDNNNVFYEKYVTTTNFEVLIDYGKPSIKGFSYLSVLNYIDIGKYTTIRQTFFKCKDQDFMWPPDKIGINSIYTRFYHKRKNIMTDFDFDCTYFVRNDGILEFELYHERKEFYKVMFDIIEHKKIDVNQPVMNGSYLIQFLFQDTENTENIKKLLDIGAKLFDNNGRLFRGSGGKTIIDFCNGKITSDDYNMLLDYYENDTYMLDLVKRELGHKQTNISVVANIPSLTIVLEEEEKKKVDDSWNNLIPDKEIRNKVLVYYAKQLLKKN